MEPTSALPHSVSDTNTVILPHLPPMSDALPMVADSALERPPTPRGRERHHRSQSSLLMELLSRRMSRQTLLQQHHSRTSQPPLVPQSTSLIDATLDSSLCTSSDMAMEVDLDETLPCTQRIRPSRRYLPLPHAPPAVPETRIDPEVAARVIAKMQANAQSVSGLPSLSTTSRTVPAIEIDPSEQADAELEADEGYGEGPDEYPWLSDKPSIGLTGALRSQGLLSFTTSSEAALRCPKLVRNVPRMRKRSHKKKEHRLRTSREMTGEMGQPQTPTRDVADKEASSSSSPHTHAVAL